MRPLYLGLDTSNYKTSAGLYSPADGSFRACGRLLEVPLGSLGLRQSDALFQHVKQLSARVREVCGGLDGEIRAIGFSARPRDLEDSYMPCFLAGESQARVLAAALHVPIYEFSHQQGHIAAVLWSAGRLDLLGTGFLAWHLSGGTTELLLIRTTAEGQIDCEKLGGTTDISAGQLIDRTGQMLGLDFPAGKALDTACSGLSGGDYFRVRVNGCAFSLSGVQNQVQAFRDKGAGEAETAYFALRSVTEAVKKATKNAQSEHRLPVIFSGGVASNSLLRRSFPEAVFGAPQYSTDNAMGIAVLTWLKQQSNNHLHLAQSSGGTDTCKR